MTLDFALINSLPDGAFFVSTDRVIQAANPLALDIFGLAIGDQATPVLEKFELLDRFQSVFQNKAPIIQHKLPIQKEFYTLTFSPVLDPKNQLQGVLCIAQNVSELEKIHRVNSQRLHAINQTNVLLNAISNINHLVSIILEFILSTSKAEIGSIELLEGTTWTTKVHSNFPHKIAQLFKFNSGVTFSEHVRESQSHLFIQNYTQNPDVSQDTKILIRDYLCLPLFAKKKLIGLINIVWKKNNIDDSLPPEDIETLLTITTLIGTAIENAMLYRDSLKKQKLDQELSIANDIQMKLLPESVPMIDKFRFGSLSIPSREIGGDYYDFFQLDDTHLGVLIADIVGKGIPAGLFMATLKSILHHQILDFLSPKDALTQINKFISKNPVIDKFIPVFYGVLNTQSLQFTYTNAGHEPAILFRDNQFQLLDTLGFPLGGIESTDYEEKSIQLEDKDLLVMLTDGAIDVRNKHNQQFGRESLEDIIQGNMALSVQELLNKIYESIREFAPAQLQQDDVTLIGMRVDTSFKLADNHLTPIGKVEHSVSSSKTNVKFIRKEIKTICHAMGFSDSDIFNIQLAVNEAHANVIEHAYLGSETQDIHFKFLKYADRIKIVIRDFGSNQKPNAIKSGAKFLHELEGSGLGTFLIKSVMDSVQSFPHKNGSELHLTKFLELR